MTVTIRPAVPADFAALGYPSIPYRAKCLTAVEGDTVLGLGGLIYYPDGTVWASALISEAGRRFRKAILSVGREVMAMAERDGLRRVYARAEQGRAGADRYLEWLGFERVVVNGDAAWVWTCTTSPLRH